MVSYLAGARINMHSLYPILVIRERNRQAKVKWSETLLFGLPGDGLPPPPLPGIIEARVCFLFFNQ
jgi:hypothetical protein